MWAQLFISQTGGTVRGWLLDSWSEHGAPYWLPKLHWFDRGDEKFYHVDMGDGFGGSSTLHRRGEDTDIDPKRAGFIRKMLEKWELEWLQDAPVPISHQLARGSRKAFARSAISATVPYSTWRRLRNSLAGSGPEIKTWA